MRWLLVFILFSIALAVPFGTQAFSVPAYEGPVNDFAQVLPDSFEQELETKLIAYAQTTNSAEIAVVTIESLSGEPIEDVALQIFDSWKIGKASSDSGVLLLLALQDREVRIQTGYGIEGAVPDAVAGRIIRDTMTPLLREGKYAEAVDTGVLAIQQAVAGEFPGAVRSAPELIESQLEDWLPVIPFMLFIGAGLLSYAAAFLGRTTSWWLGGVIGAVLGALLLGMMGALGIGLLGLLLDYILSKNYKQWNLEGKHTSWAQSFGGFHSSGYHSSSSSKTFSFGGGRSGGGGASGKW